MDNEVIQFVGVSDLEPAEQAIVNKLASEYYEKFKRGVQNMASLKVHVKTYENEGKKKKYSINTMLVAPGTNYSSDKAADWDLARALHMSFNDIEKQIVHNLHNDTTRPDA